MWVGRWQPWEKGRRQGLRNILNSGASFFFWPQYEAIRQTGEISSAWIVGSKKMGDGNRYLWPRKDGSYLRCTLLRVPYSVFPSASGEIPKLRQTEFYRTRIIGQGPLGA